MKKGNPAKKISNPPPQPGAIPEPGYHGRISSEPDHEKCLDSVQLHQLEQSFREWTGAASKKHIRASRQRILIIFLLIRYTAAKLNEVLGLDLFKHIDFEKHFVRLGRGQGKSDRHQREVQLSEALCREIQGMITDSSSANSSHYILNADPGFVRRKFYERAEACGIAKQLAAPEILRRSRAVELMQSNMPLPAVQMLLGHSTPNLTSSYVSFSENDIQQVTRVIIERESGRKTSARNSFFGKIQTIRQGDISSCIELLTMGGHRVTTVITNDSLKRLGLKVGRLVTAEVKAPWVILHKGDEEPAVSAENLFSGVIVRIIKGEVSSEYAVRISDDTELCAIISTENGARICFQQGDRVWALFNCFAVVLHLD